MIADRRVHPLLFDLDRAEIRARDTHPVSARVLSDLMARNLDASEIPIALPVNGELRFRSVEIPARARLEFGFGVDAVRSEVALGATIRFALRVEEARHADAAAVEAASASRELWSAEVLVPPQGTAPARRAAPVCDLEGFAGRTVDVVFETSTDRSAADPANVSPVLLSPRWRSEGRQRLLSEQPVLVRRVLRDLLDDYAQARRRGGKSASAVIPVELLNARKDTVVAQWTFADGRSQTVRLEEMEGLELAFPTGPEAVRDAWPALCFAEDGEIARFTVEVPHDGAQLEFRIGADARALAKGRLVFRVRIDGALAWEGVQIAEPFSSTALWRSVSIDLGPHRGKTIEVLFEGEAELPSPIALTQGDAQLEVRRLRGGFGRPLVVSEEHVPRRLARKDRPSVLFVNVETLRADAISCYGSRNAPPTPVIDRLAASGVRYTHFTSAAPWTSPSVATLFTGRYPGVHQIYQAGHFLRDGFETLAERARAAGVTTVGIVTNELLSPQKNFSQGFETYVDLGMVNARQAFDLLGDWIEDHRELQFFAFAHLFDPHWPYVAPGELLERFVPAELRGRDLDQALGSCVKRSIEGATVRVDDDDARFLRGRYFGSVHYVDVELGRLLSRIEALGIEDRLVVVLTGDHGEALGEHGMVGHGGQVFGESLLVPLIVSGTAVPSGVLVDHPADNSALLATTLDLLRVPFDWSEAGRPLDFARKDLRGVTYSATECWLPGPTLEHSLTYAAFHGVRTATHSLVVRTDPEDSSRELATSLFDLAADPFETRDVASEQPEVLELLRAALHERARAPREFGASAGLDPETLRRLESIGYTGAAGSAQRAPKPQR